MGLQQAAYAKEIDLDFWNSKNFCHFLVILKTYLLIEIIINISKSF